jgi:two-component system chemotaxis response regulator CheB
VLPKLRILVVDDSVVVRKMLTQMLLQHPAIEAVGTASNGKIALARIAQVSPDAVILDVEMPELNGLETVAAIRRIHRTLPVIMFSTVTARGAAATLDALALGANDYVNKPSSRSGTVGQIGLVYKELIDKLLAHCHVDKSALEACHTNIEGIGMPGLTSPVPMPIVTATPSALGPVAAIAIGVSTGGPNALAALLPTFPRDLAVPVFIVQHMPRLFTRLLAERLASKTLIQVVEAQGGEVVTPGKVWVAPGDFHMTVRRAGLGVVIRISHDQAENSCRPSVDTLFRSVSETYGSRALAVVMTGMGKDGLRGCEAIRAGGGQVLVQDEESSVVWGMPGFVARAGLAEKVVPLSGLGEEIVGRTRDAETLPASRNPPPLRTSL